MYSDIFFYLGNGIDDLLVVVFTVDHSLLLQRSEVSHDLTLHPLQWKTAGTGDEKKRQINCYLHPIT